MSLFGVVYLMLVVQFLPVVCLSCFGGRDGGICFIPSENEE